MVGLSLMNMLGLRQVHISHMQLAQFAGQSSLYCPGTDRTGKVSSIIVCSVVAGEMCPQSCSLAMAVVTWQWLYTSQYIHAAFLFSELSYIFCINVTPPSSRSGALPGEGGCAL
jgi:hypothetical protein